ncbi:MAG: CRTAC1 family protein [Phycisphaerae bacterium]|nr:CRTAC1 family protein [Phycisphaerae bacterium]
MSNEPLLASAVADLDVELRGRYVRQWKQEDGTPVLVFTVAVRAAAGERNANAPIVFTDVTASAGIDFVETIGDDEMTNIVESTGVGCGFVDFDNDGRLDIYLVSGCWIQGVSDLERDPRRRDTPLAASDRLYRNRGDGTFEDVTVRAGLKKPGYGMAVVAADYDNDGDQDLYVTNYGPNFLYRNNGDGTFTEVAQAAGVDDPNFGVGAVFFDYNRDGRLDLYLGNYLTYDPSNTPTDRQHIVRSPLAYAGQQDRLFRGNIDGTFTDVTRAAGIEIKPVGRAMGVGALDYDDDGLLDVFVSNDAMENYLLHNQGNGTFENRALLAGVAFSEAGAGAAAMAVEIADYDGDGWLDILVPDMNMCCLYHNFGRGLFEDVAVRSGLAAVMTRYHSWGGILADFDLDGNCDAYIANGDACRLDAQEDRLFAGNGRGRFTDVSDTAGEALAKKFVSRGVARADFDNDGDIDLLVNHLNDRPSLLRNDTPRDGRHWLRVILIGREGNRDALGALVKVTVGGRTMVQPRLSAGGYLAQHDPRLHFGLGQHGKADRLVIIWPDGTRQTLENVLADRQVVVWQQNPTTKGVP